MQVLYFFVFIMSVGFYIGAIWSSDWITYREEHYDISHGLLTSCLVRKTQNKEEPRKCVSVAFNKRYNIYVPGVLYLASGGIFLFSLIAGLFLYNTGSTRIGFWITGVLQVLAGVSVTAAACLVITLQLSRDDEQVFARDINRIGNPRKLYTPGFFIAWISGLASMCGGIVAISSAHRYDYLNPKTDRFSRATLLSPKPTLDQIKSISQTAQAAQDAHDVSE